MVFFMSTDIQVQANPGKIGLGTVSVYYRPLDPKFMVSEVVFAFQLAEEVFSWVDFL